MSEQRENKQYREAIVSFIDILGFKGMINNLSSSEIYDIYQLFKFQFSVRSLSDYEKRSGINLESDVHFFSDSVVRIKYTINEIDDTAFAVETDEIMSLGVMQKKLFNKGILIRGGVARGLIFSEPISNTLYGPALIEAYRLENEIAKTPRIVISEDVRLYYMRDIFSAPFWIRQSGRNSLWDIEYLHDIPHHEEPWFINYLWAPFANNYAQLLASHTMDEYVTNYLSLYYTVKDKSESDSLNESVRMKFAWCKNNMHETIKDIYDWILNYNNLHSLNHNTYKALKELAETYLKKVGGTNIGSVRNDKASKEPNA